MPTTNSTEFKSPSRVAFVLQVVLVLGGLLVMGCSLLGRTAFALDDITLYAGLTIGAAVMSAGILWGVFGKN